MSSSSFVKTAGAAAVLSAPVAAANLLTMFTAVHFNVSGMSDPLVLLRAGGSAPSLWRWAMVFDIFGYYLLIVPALLVLKQQLAHSPDWARLAVGCLVGYSIVGASGGAVLATAIPTLITAWGADPAHHAAIQTVYAGYSDGVYRGLWNLLEEFLAGLGWLIVGYLVGPRFKSFSVLTMTLGAACLIDSAGVAANAPPLADTALTVYLVLAPVWAVWLGTTLLRGGSVLRTVGVAGRPVPAVGQ